MSDLKQAARAWLDRQAKLERPVEHTPKHPPGTVEHQHHPHETPQTQGTHGDKPSVQLFNALGNGTVEHPHLGGREVERAAEHWIEHRDPMAAAERAALAIESGWPPAWADQWAAIQAAPRPRGLSLQQWESLLDQVGRWGDLHAARLHDLGWTFAELFGLPEAWPRLDQRGRAWNLAGAELVQATADALTIRLPDGTIQRAWKPGRGPAERGRP